MGESCFELVYSNQPALLKELYRFTFFKRPISIALMIMVFVGSLPNLAIAYLFSSTLNLLCGLLLLLFIPIRILRYALTVKTAQQRQIELYGEETRTIQIALYNDCLTMTDHTGSNLTVSYSSMKRCYQTKNLFLLLSNANLVYSFPKDTFTKGLPEHFLPFIASRGVKVK